MNDNAMMEYIGLFAIIVLVLGFGYAIYQQGTFKADAKEICITVIDFNDSKTIDVRRGNYIGEKMVYHGYDVCTNKKTGVVVNNKSLGYGTELELTLSVM